jgi:hypothetical protein
LIRKHGTKDPGIPFKTRLENLHTLEEAKTLAEGARTSGMDPVVYSKLAFKAMLANKSPLNDLLGFLKDPGINLPEVRNVMVFIAHYNRKDRSLPKRLYTTIQQLLSLGMIYPAELLEILNHLPEIDYLKLEGIWKGMKACRVIPIRIDCARQLLHRVAALAEKRDRRDFASLRLELYQHIFPMRQQIVSKEPNLGHHLAYWATSIQDQLSNTPNCPDRATLLHIISHIGSSREQYIVSATETLLRQRPSADSDLPHWRLLINDWLALLLETEPGRRHALSDGDPRQLSKFYDMISEHLTLHDLAPFFKELPTFVASCIIAQSWLPRLYPGLWSVADSLAIEYDLRVIPTTDLRSYCYIRGTDHFADIVIALARRGFDYEAPMTAIVELCDAIYGPKGVLQLARTWRYAQIRIIPEAFGDILRNLSQNSPRTALVLYQQARLWIGSSPELLPKLIDQGTTAYHIMRILNHRDPTNSVPVHLRDSPKNSLHNTRNTLVHVVADAFSRYQGVRRIFRSRGVLRSRQMFRNVYLAYRYLVTRQSSVHPLMSRALVRAGITRPLENYEWVNTSRIRWILHVVARVEGQEVASELDKKIYAWRGKVHRYIMSKEAYMRRKGIVTGQEPGAKELLLRRSLERRALRNSQSRASAPSGWFRDDSRVLEEEESDALSSLEEKMFATSMALSHHGKVEHNDAFSLLGMANHAHPKDSAQLQGSVRPALHESFSISPQFEENEGDTPSLLGERTLTTAKVPSHPEEVDNDDVLSSTEERIPTAPMASSQHNEAEQSDTSMSPDETVQSLLEMPVHSSKDLVPRQRNSFTSSPAEETISTSSRHHNHLGHYRLPATSMVPASHNEVALSSLQVTNSAPLKISKQLHGPAFLISTVRGGIRDELTQFKTTKSSMIRYQIDESFDQAGKDRLSQHPLKKRMTVRGDLMICHRYMRNKDGIFMRVDGAKFTK